MITNIHTMNNISESEAVPTVSQNLQHYFKENFGFFTG
jgi:hypothetical protein